MKCNCCGADCYWDSFWCKFECCNCRNLQISDKRKDIFVKYGLDHDKYEHILDPRFIKDESLIMLFNDVLKEKER